jgi:hypothetical protein
VNTVQLFLSLAPAFSAIIQSLEKSFPPRSGPSKLNTFNNIVLGTFAIAGPLAAQGISDHSPETIIALSTNFANALVSGLNSISSSQSSVGLAPIPISS